MSIFELIEAGDEAGLRALLEQDAETIRQVSADGVTPVLFACYRMQHSLIPALLAATRELNLHEAAAVGDVDRLRELLGSQPETINSMSADGFTALHLAAFFRQPEAVRELLDRGADAEAEATNGSGLRPINSAAASGVLESVRALLQSGASPDSRQAGGFTALHAAAMHDNVEMVRELLAAGADASLRTDEGKTAAEMAPEGSAALALLPA